MIANNERNKCANVNIVKIEGHNFTGVCPSPVPIKLGARKCIIMSYLFIRLKDEVVFFYFSDINRCSKRMLATDSQTAKIQFSMILRNTGRVIALPTELAA